MTAADQYRSRLVSYEELISKIRPGDDLVLATWMGQPHGFMRALAKLGSKLDPLYIGSSPASGAGELLMQKGGISMVHVPYRGGPLALNDLLAGQIDTIIEVYPVVMEQIRSGAIKGLAVSSATRLPSLPHLPTFEEAGVPGIVLTGWLGIYVPPRMPEDIRAKLGAAIVEVINQPDIEKKFRDIGFEPMIGQGVAAFTAYHEAEVKRWVAFLTELGLRK